MSARKRPDVGKVGGPKFRIFDNRIAPDESYVECCNCGVKAKLTDDVEITIRAPRRPSDMVRDA